MRLFRRGEKASTLDLLVAGLGNPGRDYESTRHNLGWVVLDALAKKGHKMLAAPAQVGNKWIATADNPKLAVAATVEKFGMKSIVTGPTREAVELKVKELQQFGARLDQQVELVDGVWTAVCDSAS